MYLLAADAFAFVATAFINWNLLNWKTELLNTFSMASFELFSQVRARVVNDNIIMIFIVDKSVVIKIITHRNFIATDFVPKIADNLL